MVVMQTSASRWVVESREAWLFMSRWTHGQGYHIRGKCDADYRFTRPEFDHLVGTSALGGQQGTSSGCVQMVLVCRGKDADERR